MGCLATRTRHTYRSLWREPGYCNSTATWSALAPRTGTHLEASEATSAAWMMRSGFASAAASDTAGCASLRLGSWRPWACPMAFRRFRPSSAASQPSSDSESLSNSTRSLAGEGRCAAPASLRLRSTRRSSGEGA